MRATRRTIVLFGLAMAICQVSYAQKEAIVEILVVKELQQHSLGTGFFFGDGSTVLTCYHVVRGAKEIRIVHKPERDKPPNVYTDVIMASYSPDHDLATLQIRDIPKGMLYVRPAAEIPSWKEGQELVIYGHPHGIFHSRLRASALHDGYRLSGEITDRKQAPIFNIKDVNLVMLEATIYVGMSGGPVLFEGNCVGVLSGCKHEGGTIGWAIPCMYAEPQRMIPVGKALRDIANWPPLRLMTPQRATLIHIAQIEQSTQDLLDEYSAELQKLEALHLQLDGDGSKTLAGVTALRLMMQGGLSKGARPKELFSNPVYKSTRDEMTKSFRALMETRNLVLDSENKAAAYMNKLMSASTALFKTLPRTQKNGELPEEHMRLIRTLGNELTELEQANASKEYTRTGQEAMRAMGKPPTDWPEMNTLLKALEAHLSATLDPGFRNDRTEMMRISREVGYVLQRIFVEEYDTRDMDWVFNCDKGYRMVIPAGWQIDAWPDKLNSNAVDPVIHDMGLEPCLYVTNRTGDDLRDAVYTAICTFSSQLESSPMDKKLEYFRTVASSGDREVEIHREGAISYCAVTSGAGMECTYFAMAARPERTVFLWALPFDRKYLAAVTRALPAMVSSVEPTH